jgi:hypothetical protein
MADHVHRNSPVGKPVMLLKTWYYTVTTGLNKFFLSIQRRAGVSI